MENEGRKEERPVSTRKRIAAAVVIIVAVVAAVIAIALYLGSRGAALAPTLMVNGEIAPDTLFELTLKEPASTSEIREMISFDPPISYYVESHGEDESIAVLVPMNPLEPASRLRVTVSGKEFSYTVQNVLVINDMSPWDGGRSVPVTSGIEVAFNTDEITPIGFGDAFSIDPPVAGEFTSHGNRYIFYPTEDMEYETEYTVTISGGLAGVSSIGGATLREDFVFSFVTASDPDGEAWLFNASSYSRNVMTTDPPIFNVTTNDSTLKTVAATVYTYGGWEDYRQAVIEYAKMRRSSQNPVIATDELEQVAEYELELIKVQEDGNLYMVELPESLPEGWYAVRISAESPKGYLETWSILLQVSDLSVFYMMTDSELVAWINDGATGQPLEGAEFEMVGLRDTFGVTDAEGIMTTEIPINEDGEASDSADDTFLITVTSGNRAFVDYQTRGYYYYGGYSSGLALDYYSYLFTDRPIYHTTDTIQVWGVVRPRQEQAAPLEDLWLNLSGGAVKQEVTLLGDGTFTATVKFENLVEGSWSSVQLMSGETQLSYAYVSVEDFVKPIYTATTQTEYPVYMTNEGTAAAVLLNVSMYDGTPATKFPVSMESSMNIRESYQTTGAQGEVRVEVEITDDNNTWIPQRYNYYFRSEDAQSESFFLAGGLYAIHRDVMLVGKPELGEDSATLTLSTHRVDISQVETAEDVWDYDLLRGEALTQQVTAQLYHVYYTKEEMGTYYDFINRVRRTSYQYVRNEDLVDTYTVTTTQNGSYVLEDLPLSSREGYYYVDLSTRDSRNKLVETRVYLGCMYDRYTYWDSQSDRYVLEKEVDWSGLEADESGEFGGYYIVSMYFEDGEDVSFVLENNDEPVSAEDFQGRLLTAVAQKGFTHIQVHDSERVAMPFGEDLVPNYLITGAYFDGRYVHLLENKYMYFDPSLRELEIELTPDQDAYGPGEEMEVTATVTDVNDAPVKDAAVVLVVVDEAIFALREQSADLLSSFYAAVYFPNIHKYVSHIPPAQDGGAEKGGGGDGNMRTEFEDTADFQVLYTNADGKAVFAVELSDNITSWRLTSLALSPDNYAGAAKINVASTLEYFLIPVVPEIILEGDTFGVGLRGAGTGVEDDAQTQYTVTVKGDGYEETQTVGSPVRTYASLRFENLPKGEYTVTIEGECEDYWDGVMMPFSVAASGVEVSVTKTFSMGEKLDIDPLRYPVSIVFYDQAYQDYNQVFQNVLCESYGERADMRLARVYTAQQFEKWGGTWYNDETAKEKTSDLRGYSLLSYFPYTDGDLELTVKAHLALPEYVSSDAISWTAGDSSQGTMAVNLLAQAMIGAEIDEDLEALALEDSTLPYVDRIYLALALFVQGETGKAQACYDALVTPYLSETTGVSGQTASSVRYGSEKILDATAAASLLATALELEDAHSLARYLAHQSSKYDPYLLEKLYYLTTFEPEGGGAQFSYVLDGETVTETLDRYPKTYTFTKEQLENASFTQLSGQIYMDVYYAGTPEEMDDESKKLIGITRTIEVVGGGPMEVGAVVKVTLNMDFSALSTGLGDPSFVIDEYIPSGLRFEQYHIDDDLLRWWWLSQRQGQRLRFVGNAKYLRGSIIYYARCTTPGEYIVESAFATSSVSEIWGATPRDTIEIE